MKASTHPPKVTSAPRQPAPTQPAKMLIVDRQGRGDYTTIAEAIAQAPNGSLIIVRPGHYLENLSIDRPLTIMGDSAQPSMEPVEIHGNIVINTADAIFQKLKICIVNFGDTQVLPQGIDDIRLLAASHPPKMLTGNRAENGHADSEGSPSKSSKQTVPPGTNNNLAAAVIVLQGALMLQDCLLQGGRGSAIYVCNAETQLTMRNCIIQNSDVGIYQAPYTQVDLEQCEIRATERLGIFADRNSCLTLYQCQIHSTVGNGIVLEGCDRVLIDQCQIFNNRQSGLGIKGVLDFQIQQSQIYDHGNNGICLQNRSRGIIRDCDIFGSGWPNVVVVSGASVEILQSHIHEGLGEGIMIDEGSQVKIIESTIEQHNNKAIWIGQNCTVNIDQCQILQNTHAGLWIEPTGHAIVEQSCFQDNGYARQAAAIESEGKAMIRRCRIQRNYMGIHSGNTGSVIVKFSNVSANANGAFGSAKDGTISKFFSYEGLIPMLQLQNPWWKVVGGVGGVAIGLYGTHQLVQFVQQQILAKQAQIQTLEQARDGMQKELETQDFTHRLLQESQQEQLAAKQQELQNLKKSADAEKQKLEQQNQDLQTQLEQARRPSVSPLWPIMPEPRVTNPESTLTQQPSIEAGSNAARSRTEAGAGKVGGGVE